ncbi:MAG: hypothetical protein KJO10_10580 [Gammaproteobacteria bacterium]|nr:hypothetical protein [Gammaproteobacteria bacterium]
MEIERRRKVMQYIRIFLYNTGQAADFSEIFHWAGRIITAEWGQSTINPNIRKNCALTRFYLADNPSGISTSQKVYSQERLAGAIAILKFIAPARRSYS